MFCEPDEYLSCARSKDPSFIEELFDYDNEILNQNLLRARAQDESILPTLERSINRTVAWLSKIIAAIVRLKVDSYTVVNTYDSDGDRYFKLREFDKWSDRIVRFQPDIGKVSLICLPSIFDISDS